MNTKSKITRRCSRKSRRCSRKMKGRSRKGRFGKKTRNHSGKKIGGSMSSWWNWAIGSEEDVDHTIPNVGPVLLPDTLPLSIQIHEFALFVHYQLRDNDPNFAFYVQPLHYMAVQLKAIYGERLCVTKDYEQDEYANIQAVCEGKFPCVESSGMKIGFDNILNRYMGRVPEKYLFTSEGEDGFKNEHGFHLLVKKNNAGKIRDFYDIVRTMFCNIKHDEDINNYIRELKAEFTPGTQGWGAFGSLDRRANFESNDALRYLETWMNQENIDDERLRRLLQYYVNIFAYEMGGVKQCEGNRDMVGIYMLVKLKDPTGEFVYDNTEMVVHQCNFLLGNPAQYHIGIMRNPSDLLDRKFSKLPGHIYRNIIRLNKTGRMF